MGVNNFTARPILSIENAVPPEAAQPTGAIVAEIGRSTCHYVCTGGSVIKCACQQNVGRHVEGIRIIQILTLASRHDMFPSTRCSDGKASRVRNNATVDFDVAERLYIGTSRNSCELQVLHQLIPVVANSQRLSHAL